MAWVVFNTIGIAHLSRNISISYSVRCFRNAGLLAVCLPSQDVTALLIVISLDTQLPCGHHWSQRWVAGKSWWSTYSPIPDIKPQLCGFWSISSPTLSACSSRKLGKSHHIPTSTNLPVGNHHCVQTEYRPSHSSLSRNLRGAWTQTNHAIGVFTLGQTQTIDTETEATTMTSLRSRRLKSAGDRLMSSSLTDYLLYL